MPAAEPTTDELLARAQELKNEAIKRAQRVRWLHEPDTWAKERLKVALWGKQREIMRSVVQHHGTAVQTCHGIGKSFSASVIAAWWIDVHNPGEAFVVTTAPTQPQIKVILWKEIGRRHSEGELIGRVNQTEWLIRVNGKEEIVAMGRKPSDYSPTAFQGIHAPFVLVIVDEANGVRGNLWAAFDAVLVNEASRALAIGNPDDPEGEFYQACRPGSGWNVIQVGAFDTPNFTGEPLPKFIKDQLISPSYVERNRKKWAPTWYWNDEHTRVIMPDGGSLQDTHPFWQSKILGQFPITAGSGSLIPLSWIRSAQDRTLDPVGASEIGMDVGASESGDSTCCGHRKGGVFRILWEHREPDTMVTTGRLLQSLADPKRKPTKAKVDYIGVGRGVVDRAREQGHPVIPIQVGERATMLSCLVCKHEWDSVLAGTDICPVCSSHESRPIYADLLSQLWWEVRQQFERGEMDLDPNDDELAEQLLMVRWKPNSTGQLKVFYADGPSPNRADALLFTMGRAIEREQQTWATW